MYYHFMSQITSQEKFYINKCIIKIETNDKLEKMILKIVHAYFDDIIKIEDFDPDKFSIDKKPHENILVKIILYRILIDSKPLNIRFYKIGGFISVYGRTRYLVLFGIEKYDSICNSIVY